MIPRNGLALVSVAIVMGMAPVPVAAEMRDESWTIGSLSSAIPPLASTNLDRSNLPRLLGDKLRIGSIAVPVFGDGIVAHPWLSQSPRNTLTGILVDLPLGGFRLTPSIGAGYVDHSAAASRLEIRSQLELGYEFDNRSRFTLGVSRTSDDRSRSGGPNNDVFGFYYRLPIGR